MKYYFENQSKEVAEDSTKTSTLFLTAEGTVSTVGRVAEILEYPDHLPLQ